MSKIKKITEQSSNEEKETLVKDLIKWLVNHNMFSDINIYCNNKCWKSDNHKPHSNMTAIRDNSIYPDGVIYVYDNINVKQYIEYANPKLITMSFEGPLYHALNYGNWKLEQELNDFFAARGLYFELGYAWPLSLYEL